MNLNLFLSGRCCSLKAYFKLHLNLIILVNVSAGFVQKSFKYGLSTFINTEMYVNGQLNNSSL